MTPPTVITTAKTKPPAWSLLILFFVIVGISAGFTQYFAMKFAYQSALGSPVIGHVYQPFAWIQWSFQFHERLKSTWNMAHAVFAVSVLSSFFLYSLAFGLSSRRSQKHDGIHGTAHWASESEIRKTGLLSPLGVPGKGVYVGGWQDKRGRIHYLRHNGPEHIAAIAPTRSGKGVGLVIPTLLSWPDSAVIHDMKGELWALTAGWRQQSANNRVLKFDPTAENGSCRFNPLQEVRLGEASEVADVQNLVTIIVDPDGRGLNDHWAKTAHALLTGVTLHLLYLAKNKNDEIKKNKSKESMESACLYDVSFALSDPSRPIDKLYQEMLETKHLVDHNDSDKAMPHPVVAAAARDMMNRPEQERGSVLSTAMSYLSLYRDPIVASNTSVSDFSIWDLMNHEKPVSLYLVVRPADKDRLKPLMRLVLNQIVRVLTRQGVAIKSGAEAKNYNHRLLLMLDEFPSFGRLEVFQEALAFIAGYGIKAYLIMQDITQLHAAYGKDESILSNCHVRIAYAPNNADTAKWLSTMVGTTTVTVSDTSLSGKRFSPILQHVNQSIHSVARPLLTPDECMNSMLPGPTRKPGSDKIQKPGNMIVFYAGSSPIYATQILYFKDPVFTERARIPAPHESDRLDVPLNTLTASEGHNNAVLV